VTTKTCHSAQEKYAEPESPDVSARVRISLLGAGNMGTAMAHALASTGHDVAIWDFFPEVVEDIRERRENRRFLPGVRLAESIRTVNSPIECVEGAALVAVCVPSPFVSSTLSQVLPELSKDAILLNIAKGFEPSTRQLLPFFLKRLAEGHPCVHLAGPVIANELMRGQAASIVFASTDADASARVAGWFSGRLFQASTTTDVTGAAFGGILKNVYAILLGCQETISPNSRNLEAAVLTASVREMAAIAVVHGGQPHTIYGLAGLGDLVATGFSRDSHNRRFGQQLAAGQTVAEIRKEVGWLPEGVQATHDACAIAKACGVRAVMAQWVRRTLGGKPPSLSGLLRALRASTTEVQL